MLFTHCLFTSAGLIFVCHLSVLIFHVSSNWSRIQMSPAMFIHFSSYSSNANDFSLNCLHFIMEYNGIFSHYLLSFSSLTLFLIPSFQCSRWFLMDISLCGRFSCALSVSELHSYKEYGLVIKMLDFTLNEPCLRSKKIKIYWRKMVRKLLHMSSERREIV